MAVGCGLDARDVWVAAVGCSSVLTAGLRHRHSSFIWWIKCCPSLFWTASYRLENMYMDSVFLVFERVNMMTNDHGMPCWYLQGFWRTQSCMWWCEGKKVLLCYMYASGILKCIQMAAHNGVLLKCWSKKLHYLLLIIFSNGLSRCFRCLMEHNPARGEIHCNLSNVQFIDFHQANWME